MRLVSKKRLITSLILSFLALYLNGLWEIRADNEVFSLASLILVISQLLILITLSFFGYFILGDLRKQPKRIILILAAISFMAVWFYFLFDGVLPPSYYFYVGVGTILNQKYGINWFWMDWGVWVQCITVYTLGFFLYLVTLLLNYFPKLKPQK